MEKRGMAFLRSQLNVKRARIRQRYAYYDMHQELKMFSPLIPVEYMQFVAPLGWCGRAVDSLADRLVCRGFDNDNFGIGEIYEQNSADVLFDSAFLGALISACSFIYISADTDGAPRLQVIDGANATGVVDPITHMLYEGYAVLERDKLGNPTLEAYFEPGITWFYSRGQKPWQLPNPAPWPLLVPVVYRPDAVRALGHSRISRSCMSLVQGAMRTLLRMEVAAEFYSFPQKYVTGLAQDAELADKYKMSVSAFLQFTKDSEGDSPKLGQFQQASTAPLTEQMRSFAALFAAETGLTMDDLGFVSDNPSSVEAIRASHETLRLTARKAQRTFGVGLLNAGYLAACLRDDYPYQRSQLYQTRAAWEPLFEPDINALGGLGDAVTKLNGAVPGYITPKTLRDLTGIAPG